MCYQFLQNTLTRIVGVLNQAPIYTPTAICFILLGVFSSFFNYNEDPDERSIRRMLERDSRNSTNISTRNSIIRQSELTATKADFNFKFMICWMIFCVIVLTILIFHAHLSKKNAQVEKERSVRFKKLDERCSDLQNHIDEALFSNKLEVDEIMNQYEQKINAWFVNQQKKLKQHIYESQKKAEVTVSKNIERIEQVKKGFIDLLETDDELRGTLRRTKMLERAVSNAENSFAAKFKEMDDQVRRLNTIINKLEDKSGDATLEVCKGIDIVKVNCYKSSIQLLNSKILFDAALSKFEVVQNSLKELVTEGQEEECPSRNFEKRQLEDAQQRLEKCLKESISVRRRLEMIECKRENEMSNSHTLSLILDEHSLDPKLEMSQQSSDDFGYFKIYSDANDLAISDLNDRVSKLEQQISKVPGSDSLHNRLSNTSEDLLNNWISALYGMLNTDVMRIRSHIFGLEELEALNLFEETGHQLGSQYAMISEFVDICKRYCTKIMSTVSIIVLESHLVKNQNDEYITKECKLKIRLSLDDIFEQFKKTVFDSSISSNEKNSLLELLAHFRERLLSDLITAAVEYLSLFRQNINDFQIIHDSLNSLNNSSETSKESEESILSFVSGTSDSSKNSILSTSSWRTESDQSFKPLKLVQRVAKDDVKE